jgi:hypothetical protein
MAYSALQDVLRALLDSSVPLAVRHVLTEIGDHADVGLDEPFGEFGLQWHAFGDNPSNISTIGLGTKPGRSLTERLTNAMDAILEDRLQPNVAPPESPRAAAMQWFGRGITGPDDGLYKWNFGELRMDRRIAVVMTDSGTESAPTVDVVDDGVGMTAEHFPDTILSLQSGNKIRKWYLIGAFGQGGASSLGFCEYALIASRSRDRANEVAFTVIRPLRLDESYKEDTYAYLAVYRTNGTLVVPSFTFSGELRLYAGEHTNVPALRKGTVVRHYGYKLSNLEKTLSASPGNLYHYLHVSMFDPLFPFRVIDLRDPHREKDELVTGSRNRLMKLGGKVAPGEDESGTELKHHREMEYVVPHGAAEPMIGIEYWVVLSYRKGSGARKDEFILRPQSNELFVQSNHPIIGTLNGQNQGEMTAQLLREIGLPMVAKHVVIHVDASNASRTVRRDLFATSREGFKDGPVLAGLLQVLRKMLEEDENLAAIERELNERMARREAQTTSEEVRRQVTKLLIEAGFQPQKEGPAPTAATQGDKHEVHVPRPHKPIKPEPLPTLPFPDVTFLSIVAPKPSLLIHENDLEVILVQTDADAEYDRRNRLAIRSEPDVLEVVSKTPLRGGRVRWRLRPKQGTAVGQTGNAIVTLTRLDGSQLTDSLPFEVLQPAEQPTKRVRGQVPPFNIIPINPFDHQEEWGTVWPNAAENGGNDTQKAVAYKAIRATGGVINVYYSTIFAPFESQLQRLGGESAAMAELFRTNYEVWIGYHAILQESASATPEVDPEMLDRILEEDRARVAQMQVKQALQMAELMRRAMREQAVGAEP